MKLLRNILIQPNVINEKGIQSLLNHIKSSNRIDLEVFDPENTNRTGNTEWKLNKEVRDTQMAPIEPVLPSIHALMKNIVLNVINPYYNFEIDSSEIPQILCYSPGGHYKPHCDGEGLWHNPDGSVSWRKSVDRDLSTIIYLNNDYEGGDLVFPELKIRIRPEPGMLLAFPSTHEYIHGVEPVISGERFAIVSWMTVKGFPTVADQQKEFEAKYASELGKSNTW